jgi:hypothetical protein
MRSEFYLYAVRYGVKWKSKGKRAYWDDENTVNVVAGPDGREALKMVEKRAKTQILDGRDLTDGVLWHSTDFRLVSISQGSRVTI